MNEEKAQGEGLKANGAADDAASPFASRLSPRLPCPMPPAVRCDGEWPATLGASFLSCTDIDVTSPAFGGTFAVPMAGISTEAIAAQAAVRRAKFAAARPDPAPGSSAEADLRFRRALMLALQCGLAAIRVRRGPDESAPVAPNLVPACSNLRVACRWIEQAQDLAPGGPLL